MLQIKYAEKTKTIKEIEEKLDSLALAYKSVHIAGLTVPEINEGQKVIAGLENMIQYIDQLEIEIQASRNFAC